MEEKRMETNMTQMKVNENKGHFLNNTYTSQLGQVERSRKWVIIAKRLKTCI